MRFTQIKFNPECEVIFSPEEIEVLIECGTKHYDGLCNAVVKPGKGSFIWGAKMSLKLSDNPEGKAVWLTLDNLDLMSKILEEGYRLYDNEHGAYYSPFKSAVADGLRTKIKEIFEEVKNVRPINHRTGEMYVTENSMIKELNDFNDNDDFIDILEADGEIFLILRETMEAPLTDFIIAEVRQSEDWVSGNDDPDSYADDSGVEFASAQEALFYYQGNNYKFYAFAEEGTRDEIAAKIETLSYPEIGDEDE